MADAYRISNVFRVTISGRFTCDRTGTVFTLRCAVPASAVDSDADGDEEIVRALAFAALDAHRYEVEPGRTTIVDMRDIKSPRRQPPTRRAGQRA